MCAGLVAGLAALSMVVGLVLGVLGTLLVAFKCKINLADGKELRRRARCCNRRKDLESPVPGLKPVEPSTPAVQPKNSEKMNTVQRHLANIRQLSESQEEKETRLEKQRAPHKRNSLEQVFTRNFNSSQLSEASTPEKQKSPMPTPRPGIGKSAMPEPVEEPPLSRSQTLPTDSGIYDLPRSERQSDDYENVPPLQKSNYINVDLRLEEEGTDSD